MLTSGGVNASIKHAENITNQAEILILSYSVHATRVEMCAYREKLSALNI